MRGKTKIGTSTMMLSLIVSSLLMALTVASASASPTAKLEMPTLVNPLYAAGDTFSLDVTIDDVSMLWSFSFYLSYDTSILTVVDYARVRGSPVGMINELPSGINDEDGYMYMGATREVGDTVGFTTSLPIPVAIITFKVDARGETTLDLYDMVLTDIYGGDVLVADIDGYFDNRFDGEMIVPEIIDLGLTPGSPLDVYISIQNTEYLWGVQFTLTWDPNMLELATYEGLAPLGEEIQPVEGDGWINLPIACDTAPYLTTVDPHPIARFGFTVLDTGVTRLGLPSYPTCKGVDADGNVMVLGGEDGAFANTYDLAVALDTGFVEDSNYRLSDDPEGLQTLTGQIKNAGTGITTARVRFTVLDAEGFPVAILLSEEVSMTTPLTVRLSVDLDATGLDLDALYDAVFRVEYLDASAAWVAGQKGAPGANRSTMIKHFTVEA